MFSFSARSAQAEERQDEHDDDDQTDEINDTIHGCLLNDRHGAALFVASRHPQNPARPGKVPFACEFGEEGHGWFAVLAGAT